MSDPDEIPESDRVEGAPHPRETPELFGQDAASATFLDAFNQDRLHHSWLITGPKGIGKATLAWNITRFLLASDEDTGMFGAPATDTLQIAADNPVFRRTAALAEPGVFLCRRPWDEKKKRLKTAITVEEVRKLKSFFTLSAADGGWRIAIVDAADEMNTSAENALLKVLEEPPAKTLILLISHQPAKLLPTIRSRCRELRCNTLSSDALGQVMTQAGFPDDNSETLNALSGGSAGESIDLLANDGLEIYQNILSLLSTAPRMNRPRIIALGEKCAGKGSEARYDMTIRLLMLALSRLALNGAKGQTNTINGEAELATRLSANPYQAREWAVLVQDLTSRIAHARAVNLDPAQVILDTFLSIDATAGRASLLSA
ncbi:MAG: DNA polymerase III subunit delta' [Rhodobacteraceae bacterium]|nr:MAG: DNA polymerase III subunit delta' [Paracoccaceae bacterium]